MSGSVVGHCDTCPGPDISVSQEHGILIFPSEAGSGLGVDFYYVEAYAEEAVSLGYADTANQAEESAVDRHFFPAR